AGVTDGRGGPPRVLGRLDEIGLRLFRRLFRVLLGFGRLFGLSRLVRRGGTRSGVHPDERLADFDDVALLHQDFADLSRLVGRDFEGALFGLDDGDDVAGLYRVAGLDADFQDAAFGDVLAQRRQF